MGKVKKQNILITADATVTRRRSERKAKRKEPSAFVVDIGPKRKTKETVQKCPTSEISNNALRDQPKNIKTGQSTSGNSRDESPNRSEQDLLARISKKKKKKTTYEIDCTRINLDVTDFKKELWRRAKDGKFKSVKDMRMKLSGKTIYITTHSYVPKKCIRSNVYFLAKNYLKKKNIDRPIHIVGDKNVYQLVHK